MINAAHIKEALRTALPIMLGYLAIGIPCGLLSASIGMNVLQVLVLSLVFYSGAGQFMLSNMWLAGAPLASIVISIAMVSTRQTLYSAALAPYCRAAKKRLTFLFAATVTDESYGVNAAKFATGTWSVGQATVVNICSQLSWSLANVIGLLVGGVLGIPLAIASFAMTSIFICLLVTQKISAENVVAALVAMVGVYLCKLAGLGGLAIVAGAVAGVVVAMVFLRVQKGAPWKH